VATTPADPQWDPQGDPAAREDRAVHELTKRLKRSFADTCTDDQVNEAVTDAHHRFDNTPVRDFVPILVERMAREQLQACDR
jgi:hypothetical protein